MSEPTHLLSRDQLDAIFQRERGIPQAEEMRRLFGHIEALNEQLCEAKSVPRSPTLTFAHLRAINAFRCATHYHPIDDWSPNDWMGAVTGEIGELASALKNIRRKQTEVGSGGHGIPAVTLQNVADEAADVVIYLDLLCARMGIDLGEAVVTKFNHVSRFRLGDGPVIRMTRRADRAWVKPGAAWAKPGVWTVWDEHASGAPADGGALYSPVELLNLASSSDEELEWIGRETNGTLVVVSLGFRRPATTEETAVLNAEQRRLTDAPQRDE